ncbi:MAG: peptide chain release factor N(5)-glutamine methyltransferase [Deltaproteobacteria bacterium]|nr:peptide chain release factor N(5)-glutamine methyltransferase [Deltaproteobacteria bacterium]MBW1818879.1 peptide chain release factor N(5)-glutamine methyltransferase [Deltaproteobacteria bacterium]MBW2285746.1 peptide chain release factor N(5)-glutamine methyltransferase [Deltaproteobacteria bacterium]
MPENWTIQDLLRVTSPYLGKKGIDNPRLDAEVLLAFLLGTDRVDLYLNFDQPLTEKEISGYRTLIRRRVSREPLQYITGHQEFWSLDFAVDRRVLIPRPETELLVEKALELAGGPHSPPVERTEILDLGTGAGPIAVTLAHELPSARIVATDISGDSLQVARLNATNHGVLDRLILRCGDLWEALEEADGPFHLIVSNPPYVAGEEFPDLPPEVRDFEPESALLAGEKGFYYVERIIREALPYIRQDGWLMVEMAPSHTEKALRLMDDMKGYASSLRIRDYSGRYRVAMGRKA